MSGRMMRRALRQKQSGDPIAPEDEDEKSDEEQQEHSGGAQNIFSLLGSEEGTGEDEDAESPPPPPRIAPEKSRPPSKKKRGKKKMVEDERKDEAIDRIMQELDISGSAGPVGVNDRAGVLAVLATEPKYLRAQEELRRIFGSKVIKEVERRENDLRRRRPGIRNAVRFYHKTHLVSPMDNWPRWDGGISMVVDGSKDGVTSFRYVYSGSYLTIQKEYDALVASHNINGVAMLLAHHPYHVDSLLSMAEVYRHMGELQQSAVLLERCLYALECAWHPSFNPMAGGKCRLDYSVAENKPLFQALHRHMQQLGRRGCHRTALEVGKLLLSLDPEDPFGALFCIDYYALRAEQYEWLDTFVAKYGKDLSLAILPSFSLSLAVARFYLESATQTFNKDADALPSSDLLQQALMLHPLVLGKIVAKAPIQEDGAWLKLLKHPFFAKANAGGPTLEHLINIYIERNSVIWRAPDLQKWLKEGAAATIDAVSRGEGSDWACARDQAFQAVHNEYQHLMVSEFSDSLPSIPPELLRPQAGEGPAGEGPEPDVSDIRDRNPLLVFLESFIPWIHYGSGNADMQVEEGQEEEEDLRDE